MASVLICPFSFFSVFVRLPVLPYRQCAMRYTGTCLGEESEDSWCEAPWGSGDWRPEIDSDRDSGRDYNDEDWRDNY